MFIFALMNRLLLVLTLSLVATPASVRAQTPAQDVKAGNAALERDDFQSAEKCYSRALGAKTGDPNIEASARHGRGEAWLQLHRWSEAKDDLTRAIELDPTDAGAYAARGMARKALGDTQGLLLDAAQAAKISPAKYSSFQEDAKSTVLYQRVLIGFLVLAGLLLCVGAVPLVRTLVRITRAGG